MNSIKLHPDHWDDFRLREFSEAIDVHNRRFRVGNAQSEESITAEEHEERESRIPLYAERAKERLNLFTGKGN
jgi:hypothetical protein